MDIATSGLAPLEAEVDHLIVFTTEGDDLLTSGTPGALNDALGGGLAPLAESGELEGTHNETVLLHTLGRVPTGRVVLAGLGTPEKLELDHVRNAAARAARRAREIGGGTLGVAVDGEGCGWTREELGAAIAEGLDMGLYRFDRHQAATKTPKTLDAATLFGSEPGAIGRGVTQGRALAGAANFARDLANEPSNVLTPTELAARAEAWAGEHGVEIEILDEAAARELGMGSFLGVAAGSHQPARFLVMRHRGGGASGARLLRQGHHLRHRRHLDQAGGQHGGDEAGHERRSGRGRRDGAIADLNLPLNVTALAPAPRTCRAARRSSRATC